jgi:thymidylate synthase
MKPTIIEARDLPDAWYQCLYEILRVEEKGTGRVYKIDKGSYKGQERLEFGHVTVGIKFPEIRPLAPDVPASSGIPPPTSQEYIDKYLPYLLTDVVAKNEQYTYGERLVGPKLRLKEKLVRRALGEESDSNKIIEISADINPVEKVIEMYKNMFAKDGGYGTNQATLEIGMPHDIDLADPPCLRIIDTEINEIDGEQKLNFIAYFRSWDLWGGFPTNLGGLQLMKEYMAQEIGVLPGETIASCKSLHLYDDVWEIANQLTYNIKKDDLK